MSEKCPVCGEPEIFFFDNTHCPGAYKFECGTIARPSSATPCGGWTLLRARCEIKPPISKANPDTNRVKVSGNESILEEALRLCRGDRHADYGHPAEDYGRTARMMNEVLRKKMLPGAELTAEDAIMFMLCVKLSRMCFKLKRDSIVDLAGYADCLQRVIERHKEELDAAPQNITG